MKSLIYALALAGALLHAADATKDATPKISPDDITRGLKLQLSQAQSEANRQKVEAQYQAFLRQIEQQQRETLQEITTLKSELASKYGCQSVTDDWQCVAKAK